MDWPIKTDDITLPVLATTMVRQQP